MIEKKPTIFLKLGGSLITDKTRSQTALPLVINRLAAEIKQAWGNANEFRLVLGHGSGSFGHSAAKLHGTRQGVKTADEWLGYQKVWYQASALNRMVIEALEKQDLPVIAFPVSASLTARAGGKLDWNTKPIRTALENGLLPVVYGDVVVDTKLGGTIFSTEDIFKALAEDVPPDIILLAGLEEGVWADYPACTELLESINTSSYSEYQQGILGSEADDVTGGMASKVQEMLDLTRKYPGLKVQIFSGTDDASIHNALIGKTSGTSISE